HDRRRLLHFDVTAHATAAWIWRQMIEATPWGQHPKHLIHDRDRVYGADFATRLVGLGIESVRTPVHRLERIPSRSGSCGPYAASAWITSWRSASGISERC